MNEHPAQIWFNTLKTDHFYYFNWDFGRLAVRTHIKIAHFGEIAAAEVTVSSLATATRLDWIGWI